MSPAMWPGWAFPCLIVIATVVAMELAAMAVHRFIMHGPGWRWHESHHHQHSGLLEKNDLYAVVFAAISVSLFAAGNRVPVLWWVALGMVIYGLLYALLHDVLVHQRIRFPRQPRRGYLKRLVQAHRLHHAVREREGAVSFGFLYAPPVAKLVSEVRGDRSES